MDLRGQSGARVPKSWRRRRVLLRAALLPLATFFLCVSVCPAADLAAAQHFDTHVAPLLARRCLDCHNAIDKKGGLNLASAEAALAGGETGPAIAPGKLDDSLLWQRVADEEMPPKHPLPAAEQETLRAWIAAGAAWGTNPIDRFRYSSDSRAGYDWWALRPVRTPALPAVKQADWPRNPIDKFVLARLEQQQLAPSPPAEWRTLIRRLSFDLIGLPPTPAEVDQFLADQSPQAYERLVERLLASPHYGERWARHWLDVIRYGESQGFEYDRIRAHSYRYRDWVIRALNDDMPYDKFVRMQLAGDVLYPDDPQAVIATGYLVAGPWDEPGQKQQSVVMRAVVRQDELEDLVGTTSQAFLGLTAHCARCHDHKFDPISQADYYRLVSSLSGVRHGERDSLLPSAKPVADSRGQELLARIGALETQLAAIEAPVRERILSAPVQLPAVELPQPIARWEFDQDLQDSVGSLHGKSSGNARLDGGRLWLDGLDAYVTTAPLARPLTEKTFEAWVAPANLDQRGGGVMGVQALDGATFDAIVYGEQESRHWMAGSNGFTRTKSFGGEIEKSTEAVIHVALVYGVDRTITAYRNGRRYGQPYTAANLQGFAAATSQVIFGLRHLPPGGNKFFAGSIERAQLYDRALSATQVAASAGVPVDTVSVDQILAGLTPTERRERDRLAEAISALKCELQLLSSGPIYCNVPQQPEPTHILARGNPAQPGEIVAPGAITAIKLEGAEFDLPPDAPESARRARLAAWITAPANPLTPRVIANRIWHHHFGAGLVETPNDFGFNGARPSHPELLDWLAAELVRQNWSLKHLHRSIVLSATYQQASRIVPAAAKIDAENRLLWRKSPTRLEAEAVRDAMLSISGQLNPAQGGPGVQDFQISIYGGNATYVPVDQPTYEHQRRSVYRAWVRSGTNRFLDVFDCPDPSTTTPKRLVTTTPLQSLAMLNSALVLRLSDRLAERLVRDAGNGVPAQVERAHQLVLARPASPTEVAAATQFVATHGLPAYCRVLFCSNEMVFVD